MWKRRSLLCVIAAVMALSSSLAVAKNIYVERWGRTGPGPICGSKSTPCSTVSKALTLASKNDRILVGPGFYIGNFDVAVEGLRLESTQGPNVTILWAENNDQDIINVQQRKVRIGRKGRGFTFGNATANLTSGVRVQSAVLDGIRVEGNVFQENRVGVWMAGEKNLIRGNQLLNSVNTAIYAQGTDKLQIRDNRIVQDEGNGIWLWDSSNGIVQDNFISGANIGIRLNDSSQGNRIADNAVVFAKGGSDAGIWSDNVQGNRLLGNVATLAAWGVLARKGDTIQTEPLVVSNSALIANSIGLLMSSNFQGTYEVRADGNTVVRSGIASIEIEESARPTSMVRNNLVEAMWGIDNNTAVPVRHTRSYFGLLNGAPSVQYTGTAGAIDSGSTEASKPNPFRAKKAAKRM